MGAFETFVNSNLGIRKPLILDNGHPTGSSKAAGIIGSEYIDLQTNSLYEKTGENNSQDWVFTRQLGSSNSEVYDISGALQSQINDVSNDVFSSSLNLVSGMQNVSVNFSDINTPQFSNPPQVVVSMSIDSQDFPESFYAYSTYNISTTGFNVAFSNEIIDDNLKLDFIISSN